MAILTTAHFLIKCISPRGFNNEGTFFYGSIEQFEAYLANVKLCRDAVVTDISKHRSLEEAAARAERELKRVIGVLKARGDHAIWCHVAPVPTVD